MDVSPPKRIAMSLTLVLPQSVEARLTRTAIRHGKSLEQYAIELLQRVADGADAMETIDEILAPFRQEVAASGMTEAELDEFFQEVREEVWQEKHGVPS